MGWVWMSGRGGPSTGNCHTLTNMCVSTHIRTERTHTLTHTLAQSAAFYWNSWTSHIPAWKVNSCRLCCITHEGKTQQLLSLQVFPEFTWTHSHTKISFIPFKGNTTDLEQCIEYNAYYFKRSEIKASLKMHTHTHSGSLFRWVSKFKLRMQ